MTAPASNHLEQLLPATVSSRRLSTLTRRDRWFLLGLAIATFLVYQPAWQGAFVSDDDMNLVRPDLRSSEGLRRTWLEPTATPQYYPAVYTVFWMEQRIFGDATLGYHLVNIAVHVAAAALVLLLLRRLKVPGALLATAIFALHPVQVESVAWITELKNTLSAVFYLAAMLCYLRFDESRSKLWYGASLALFVLALLSKTVTVTMPGAVLVIFWWQRGRLSWKRDVLPLVPFFLLSGAAGAVTVWVERATGAQGSEFRFSCAERLLISGRAVWFYAAKLLWPAELVFNYPRWRLDAGAWWQWLFPLGAFALLAAAWRIRRWTRAPMAAFLLFGGTLLPVLGIFDVFWFRYSFVADHFQYLASLAIITLIAAGATLLLPPANRRVQAVGESLGIALLLVLAALSWRQCHIYRGAEPLYRATLAKNPESWLAHNNLGVLLAGQGKCDEAIGHYRSCLAVKPDDAEALNNLGVALLDLGKAAEAAVYLNQSLAIQPAYGEVYYNLAKSLAAQGRTDPAIAEYKKALEIAPGFAMAHNNLANALERKGLTDEAIAHYEQALRLQPDNVEAHANLANALAQKGRLDEAIAHCRQAIDLEPHDAQAYNNLAAIELQQGNLDQVIADDERALQIQPNFAAAHNNLGSALAQQGRTAEAIAHFGKALELRPEYAEAHNNLANALASQGKLAEAVAQYEKALEIRPNYADAHGNLAGALERLGQSRQSIAHWQEAARLQPNRIIYQCRAAWALATNPDDTARNGPEAVEFAKRAMRLSGGQDPAILDVLAAAYAEAGQFSKAVETARQALASATGQDKNALEVAISARIKLYQSGSPYRER